VLDPALLRPGRFDRQVVVDLPDLRGREEILKVHLRKVPVSDDVQVGLIARGTPGMSGADLANLVNEAALLAARHNHDKVYPGDLEEAKDKVMLGAERKSMVMKDSEKRMTAYHEAGHAVCAIKTPGCDPMHKVTIMPRGRALGMAVTLAAEDRYSITRQQLLASLVQGYGGRVAEELTFGRDNVTTGAQSDIQKVTSLARRYVSQWGLSEAIGPILVGDNEQEVFLGRDMGHRREVSEKTAQIVDAEVTRLLGEAYERARKTLVEHADLLKRMAEALLERETLNSDEIDALVRRRRAVRSRRCRRRTRSSRSRPSLRCLAAPRSHPRDRGGRARGLAHSGPRAPPRPPARARHSERHTGFLQRRGEFRRT
jgi:cell division protease FtsH